MAFIRQYQESDFDNMSHIVGSLVTLAALNHNPIRSPPTAHQCRETLPRSLCTSEPARRLAPYIWTHQYTLLSPSTCFVVDDGTGRAVGYCIGCPDTASFCAAYPQYVREVLEGRGRANGDVRLAPPPPDDDDSRLPWIDADTGRISEQALMQLAYSARRLLLLGSGGETLLREGYRGTMHIDLLPAYQRRGWGRRLLEALVAAMKEQQDGGGLWLGVGVENIKVLPFYEKLGFRVRDREATAAASTIIMVRDYEEKDKESAVGM
ncbi:Acyl-N-acyltransferase [Cordyceps militaris]|uniref:Acyl-N-acyltransferase n=1 Tax=Cordyceps militaris TaxID=73501 RepID=A0A2H4SQ52_CORMI|nr:Acyl-N-acyltransferase [Cordyceps militaris]